MLLCHPFIDSSIFLFFTATYIKRPFTHISFSATFKICSSHLKTQSHESTAYKSFQHTHCTVFHLLPYNQFTFPCHFGSFCFSEFTSFLTTSINSDSGRFWLFTNNASYRSLSDLMSLNKVDQGKSYK